MEVIRHWSTLTDQRGRPVTVGRSVQIFRWPRFHLVAFALAMTACGRTAPPRAERSYRALKQLEGATSVGVSKLKYDELLQNAAGELLILTELAQGSQDTVVLRHYLSALEVYKDAGTLWGEQVSGAQYNWIPAGKIYLEPEGERIAKSYHLAVDTVKVPGITFSAVSKNAIPELWQRAGKNLSAGDSLVVPRLR